MAILLRRFLLMNHLRLIGVLTFLMSRRIFLYTVGETQLRKADLTRLGRVASSALVILRNFSFERPEKKKYVQKSKPEWVPLADFLKKFPNVRNADALFGSSLALFGSASLEDLAIASHPEGTKIANVLREIRFHTWAFGGGAGNAELEKLDLSMSTDGSAEKLVQFPEFRQITNDVYHLVPSGVTVDSPVSRFETFADCGLTSSGAILSDGKLVTLHSSQRPGNYFYSGQNEYRHLSDTDVTLRSKLESKSHTRLKEAVYIYCRESTNLYHWLMEMMPVALQVRESFGKKIPIVLRGPINNQFFSVLAQVLENPIHVFGPEDIVGVLVQKLHVRPAPVNTTDAFSPSYASVIDAFDRSAVERVQAWFLSKLSHEPIRYDKVFLARRSSHRGLTNESRFIELAERRGFKTMNPANLTLQEQVALFSQAEVLVGAGGGVMGNYLFAPPNARIGQLVAEQNLRLPAPALICQISGSTLYSAVGKSKSASKFRSPLDWQNADFKLSEKVFSDLLDQMES